MDPRLQLIFARRSIRRYTEEPIADKELEALLEAGMAAPSASNLKPWHMIAVTDKDRLQLLADRHPYGKMIAQAALAIVVCGDPTESARYWVQDCSAAAENILIAASALGLGAVWLGCHPRVEREEPVRQSLGIPDHIGVLCVIPVGRPAEEKPARTQYDTTRDHREYW